MRFWEPRDAPRSRRRSTRARAPCGRGCRGRTTSRSRWSTKVELLRRCRAGAFDLGRATSSDGIVSRRDESEAVGGTGLHTRRGGARSSSAYWIRASRAPARALCDRGDAAALTRVGFERLRRSRGCEIRVDPANARQRSRSRASSASPRTGTAARHRCTAPDGDADARTRVVFALMRVSATRLRRAPACDAAGARWRDAGSGCARSWSGCEGEVRLRDAATGEPCAGRTRGPRRPVAGVSYRPELCGRVVRRRAAGSRSCPSRRTSTTRTRSDLERGAALQAGYVPRDVAPGCAATSRPSRSGESRAGCAC